MTQASRPRLVGAAVTIVIAAAVAAGIFVLGSPADERSRRLDDRRVQDLSGIARAVDVFWTRNNSTLPGSLDALQSSTGVGIQATDPSTNAPYEFRHLDGNRYELCAVFESESADAAPALDAGFWSHRAGRQCFQRAAEAVR